MGNRDDDFIATTILLVGVGIIAAIMAGALLGSMSPLRGSGPVAPRNGSVNPTLGPDMWTGILTIALPFLVIAAGVVGVWFHVKGR